MLCNSRHVSVVDVTNPEQSLQEKITLNSLQYSAVQTNFEFKVGTIFLTFGRYFICYLGRFIHHVHISQPKMVYFVKL